MKDLIRRTTQTAFLKTGVETTLQAEFGVTGAIIVAIGLNRYA
jgi:hypothetical protein